MGRPSPAQPSGRQAHGFGMGHGALAQAVIAQAAEDALRHSFTPQARPPAGKVRLEDRLFGWQLLTDVRGPYAERRQMLCDLAGLDQSAIRRAAITIGPHPDSVDAARMMTQISDD